MSNEPFPESKALHMWEHAGLRCAIVSSGIGFVNGYVQVPETHAAYGHSYDRVSVDVHGGLTYANDRGWFGFDTGHSGDGWTAEALTGAGADDETRHAKFLRDFGVTNEWNRALLIAETDSLADQFAAMTELPDPDQWNVTEDLHKSVRWHDLLTDTVRFARDNWPQNAESATFKVLHEASELIDRPDDLTEAADVVITICSWLAATGHTTEDLHAAIQSKMAVNRARAWQRQADGAFQHVEVET